MYVHTSIYAVNTDRAFNNYKGGGGCGWVAPDRFMGIKTWLVGCGCWGNMYICTLSVLYKYIPYKYKGHTIRLVTHAPALILTISSARWLNFYSVHVILTFYVYICMYAILFDYLHSLTYIVSIRERTPIPFLSHYILIIFHQNSQIFF